MFKENLIAKPSAHYGNFGTCRKLAKGRSSHFFIRRKEDTDLRMVGGGIRVLTKENYKESP